MRQNFYGKFFKFIRGIVRAYYPRYKVEQLPERDKPVVYIAHHQNLFGPFITLLWFPKSLHAWILHVFLDQKECFKQYASYTFTERYGWNPYFAKLCAFPISYFISKLLNSGKGIPVYRGSRKIVRTFKKSVQALKKNRDIIIFPDVHYEDQSSVTKEMYMGFLNIEKYFQKETGNHASFVPLFVSKNKKQIVVGNEITFRDRENFKEEREIVYQKIQTGLNELAKKCGDI